MAYENLDLDNRQWEVYHNTDGMLIPIMDEYPNPRNTFDIYMGSDAEETGGIDKEKIAEAVTTAVAIGSQLLANRDETRKMLRQRCGSRPLRAKNRGEYDKCRERFYKEIQGGTTRTDGDYIPPPPPPPPTPTGLSTGAKIGIALGVVALGVGAYFIFRKK